MLTMSSPSLSLVQRPDHERFGRLRISPEDVSSEDAFERVSRCGCLVQSEGSVISLVPAHVL